MTSLLVAVVLSLSSGGTAQDTAAPPIEGKWLIVYAEENSKRNNAWEQRVATIRGDTLTYQDAGEDRTLKFTFGPNQTVKATPGGWKDKSKDAPGLSGVYIAGQDYFSLSLNAEKAAGKEKASDAASPKAVSDTPASQSSGTFILILRRQRN